MHCQDNLNNMKNTWKGITSKCKKRSSKIFSKTLLYNNGTSDFYGNDKSLNNYVVSINENKKSIYNSHTKTLLSFS